MMTVHAQRMPVGPAGGAAGDGAHLRAGLVATAVASNVGFDGNTPPTVVAHRLHAARTAVVEVKPRHVPAVVQGETEVHELRRGAPMSSCVEDGGTSSPSKFSALHALGVDRAGARLTPRWRSASISWRPSLYTPGHARSVDQLADQQQLGTNCQPLRNPAYRDCLSQSYP